ncbi:GDP-L-fucose synthase [Parvularcula lutaonensis]|uniref:GDP-L-fucose synthase n=1 Tax=Parvularcula lutaonensis TaxID=491923 RepID=A0ABV7M6T5_9PROT|nr:GDP-L-fucose synthase [Parvularcula lutaonensis]GGY56548.1 GDP-L-fucose synthase [Parvularcula lutaonensis]
MFDLTDKKIWVAGHRGMVGSALVRGLEKRGVGQILTAPREELDLTDQAATRAWVEENRPDAVFVPAAKVGGIYANDTYPADFLYDNLMIASNVIEASYRAGVQKLLFLGSSCIYPKHAEQPIREEALLTGPLEPTNEWYAIAKIAGIKLCQAYRKQHGCDFISAMPTNLYGPNDNYHPMNSHVIPALFRKARIAAQNGEDGIEIWGTGTPYREFLHVDDCADALIFLMERYSADQFVNVGSGSDVTIATLAKMIMRIAGLEGELRHDLSKPDGTPRKLMSTERLRNLGWTPSISLEEGLASAYDWYCQNVPLTDPEA